MVTFFTQFFKKRSTWLDYEQFEDNDNEAVGQRRRVAASSTIDPCVVDQEK
jgi:hypothetical protein